MSLTVVGGNVLSPFYSSAVFVPYSGVQVFTSFGSISGTYWSFPFVRANPRRRRGLADITHSWYPISRGFRQTQVTFDAVLNVISNPDYMPEAELPIGTSVNGYQMYLSLGLASNYPAIDDTTQYYFWVPSVFIEEVPHVISLQDDPVHPISHDIMVRANGPAFFLPIDNVGSPSPISQFISYINSFPVIQWAF